MKSTYVVNTKILVYLHKWSPPINPTVRLFNPLHILVQNAFRERERERERESNIITMKTEFTDITPQTLNYCACWRTVTGIIILMRNKNYCLIGKPQVCNIRSGLHGRFILTPPLPQTHAHRAKRSLVCLSTPLCFYQKVCRGGKIKTKDVPPGQFLGKLLNCGLEYKSIS
jgi:hypothetical protein